MPALLVVRPAQGVFVGSMFQRRSYDVVVTFIPGS